MMNKHLKILLLLSIPISSFSQKKSGFFSKSNHDKNIVIQKVVIQDSVINIVVERKLSTETNYTAINTQTSAGAAFALRNFSYTDDLININAPSITYRLKMNIAADTSFYLDSATISFTPKPALGTDKTVAVCTGNSINLTTQFSTTALTTAWTLGGNTVATPAAVITAGNYQLIATNNSGCADTALVTASFLSKPNLGADKAVSKCTDSSTNLTLLFSTTGLTPVWTVSGTSVTSPAVIFTPATYQLIATATGGCADTALAIITNNAALCPAIVETITISPNPVADNLTIKVIRVAAAKATIIITNEAGQRVYANTNQQVAGGQTYTVPMKN
ncbi:MAG: hypothetical protein HC854_04090 [Flavobacterium sp.]|nr:hypothetical protein [Flavobacterium sp.]